MRKRAFVAWPALALAFVAGCPLEPYPVPIDCGTVHCDDNNPCTLDACDERTGGCEFLPLPSGSTCDADVDACNGVARCDGGGVCVPGTEVALDDANPCTADSCDPLTGVTVHGPLAEGSACDDDLDACTGVGTCTAGAACNFAAAPVVNDADACTVDACDPATGTVTHEPIPGCVNPLWQPLATALAPSARTLHTAVWTGTRMIVWGGDTDEGSTNDGALYDPATDTWQPMSSVGAPSARHSHVAVFTGIEMLVWGGYGTGGYLANGARYNPASDSWSALPATTLGGRVGHVGAWTGTELVIWGGRGGAQGITPQSNGARYNPTTNAWTGMAAGGPAGRFDASHAYTGSLVCIFGGTNTFDWFKDGKCYAPATNAWSAMAATGAPTTREAASAAWTGTALLIWGGWAGGPYRSDGARFDPTNGATGSWTALSQRVAPSERAQNVTAWTGTELVVWGGCAGEVECSEIREDGGRYDPSTDAWTPIEGDATFPGRHDSAGVWTGSELIVFSGARGDELVLGGGRLTP